ncbi:MAG: YggS family pyridoxal phosphate-dependent enzyme [Nocardioidaceae bacterium]|nr:YggS family pyridoxal phosphate-dependent enzyme [Nocardioidaceae bacterium]
MSDDQLARTEQIRAGLQAVRERIARACAAADRDPASVTLVIVTKTYPATDVSSLACLGVRDIGESRHPEAADKQQASEQAGIGDLVWHFVGALQTNKAAAVASYASWVHSVDRLRLVRALDGGARRAGRVVDCLVQVNLGPSGSVQGAGARAGAAPADVGAVADAVSAASGLRLRGVMAVAPLGTDPSAAFARLAHLAAGVCATHPGADVVSAGMSGDLEQAVAAGATHLRVGRAVLGERDASG